jgi:hypothetical protein
VLKYVARTFFPYLRQPVNDHEELINLLTDGPGHIEVPIEKVSLFLAEIQKIAGSGSMKAKEALLDKLLAPMTQMEIKVVLRILVKNLKLELTEDNLDIPRTIQLEELLARQIEFTKKSKLNNGHPESKTKLQANPHLEPMKKPLP